MVCNDADTKRASTRMLSERVPCVEHAFKDKQATIDLLKARSEQRLMFTHLRPGFFEKQIRQSKAKVIILIRNAKDTLTSYYHFYRLATGYPGDWPQFFELFRNKRLIYGDYYDWYVDWSPFLPLSNILLVRFEDLKRQHAACVELVSRFLDRELSQDKLQKIVHATTFLSMKDNPTTNQKQNPKFDHRQGDFIRKGQVGDWKNLFDDDQSAYINRLDDHILKPLRLC